MAYLGDTHEHTASGVYGWTDPHDADVGQAKARFEEMVSRCVKLIALWRTVPEREEALERQGSDCRPAPQGAGLCCSLAGDVGGRRAGGGLGAGCGRYRRNSPPGAGRRGDQHCASLPVDVAASKRSKYHGPG